jgi:hypothetical protein
MWRVRVSTEMAESIILWLSSGIGEIRVSHHRDVHLPVCEDQWSLQRDSHTSSGLLITLYNSRSAVLIRRYVSAGGWKFIQIQMLIWCMLRFCRKSAHFRIISYGHEHTPHFVQYQVVCIVLPVWHIKLKNYNFILTLACTSLPLWPFLINQLLTSLNLCFEVWCISVQY